MAQVEGRRDSELGQGLLRGATGVRQEPAEFGDRASATRFRYVGADGECRSDELICSRCGSGSRQGAAEAGCLDGDFHGEFVRSQPPGVGAQHHAQQIRENGAEGGILSTPPQDVFVQRRGATFLRDAVAVAVRM